MRQEVRTAWQVLRLAKQVPSFRIVKRGWFGRKGTLVGWEWFLNGYHVGSANAQYTQIAFHPMDGTSTVNFSPEETKKLAQRLGLK